jgi:hypothetical protein
MRSPAFFTFLIATTASLAQVAREADWVTIFRQHRDIKTVTDDSVMLGVTVWRMRPSRPSDDRNVRLLVHEPDTSKSAELTPERVSTESPLAENDRVRISIEASQNGYLYVVDQEVYKGGETSEPILVFPTSRIRRGDNTMMAGRLIDIPARSDAPPYLRLKRSRAEQTGEMLSLIFTSSPLKEFTGAVEISKEQLAEWIKRWGGSAEKVASSSGLQSAMTAAENEAESRDLRLEPNDPPPQAIYRINAKTGNSILAQVLLRVE